MIGCMTFKVSEILGPDKVRADSSTDDPVISTIWLVIFKGFNLWAQGHWTLLFGARKFSG